MPESNLLDTLAAAAVRIFRPLVKILLRHGVSYRTCSEWLRWCYVDVAEREFQLPGRKQTKSRIAVLTGLTRVDVDRILRMPPPHHTEQDEQYHRAARVLTAWAYEPRYRNAAGQPLELDFDCTDGPGFSELVNQYSGGTPPRAVMDELERIGCIEILPERKIRLIREQFVTANDEQDLVNMGILGMSAGRLLNTIEYNLRPEVEKRRLQLMVLNHKIPVAQLPMIKKNLESRSRELVREVDAWLYQQVGDEHPIDDTETHYARAGLGLYYFEEEDEKKP